MKPAHRRHRPEAAAGFSLPTVLGLAALLALALSVVIMSIASSTHVTRDMLQRRKAFYVCDGMSRTLVKASQQYFLNVTNPNAAGLKAALDTVGGGASLPNLTPPGYTASYTVTTNSTGAGTGVIPNGPFSGMNAQLNELTLDLTASGPNNRTCKTKEALTVGLIGLFQFFAFTDGPNEISNAAPITVNGRMHSNGDFCANSFAAGAAGTYLTRVTASGRFRHMNNCVHAAPGGSGVGVFIRDAAGTGWVAVNAPLDGTSAGWQAYANTVLGKNVQDQAHAVQDLRIPFTVNPQMQSGLNMDGAVSNNNTSFRFFIDPVLGTDNNQIREERLSWQADLRIINGVWYRNDGSWPGIPIYSDHRTSYSTTNAEGIEGATPNVDQATIGGSTTQYSYYDGAVPANDLTPGVISYGSLVRTPGGAGTAVATWSPGAWCGGALVDPAVVATPASVTVPQPAPCDTFANEADFYLQGTREGFTDHRVRSMSATGPNQGHMLPINFDIAQFQAAMLNATPGELGDVFTAGFNGIVWITQTWDGQMSGLGGGQANLWPQMPSPTVVATGLPVNFCTPGGGGDMTGSGLAQFNEPACPAPLAVPAAPNPPVLPGGNPGVPNAVRLINGADISNAVFPQGLTIATNLPGYIVGNFNSGSQTPANWIPVLFAADSVSYLSNAWDDANSRWGDTTSYDVAPTRLASATTYLLASFSGSTPATPGNAGGGFINFPRFLERWSGQPCVITGSLVQGFASVYATQPWHLTNYYRPPNRVWAFDTNFSFVVNQPPGTPTFMVSAIRSWERN